MKVKSESEVPQLCLTLSDPMATAYQAPLSVGFSRKEYWSGVPSPSPLYQLSYQENPKYHLVIHLLSEAQFAPCSDNQQNFNFQG